MDRVGRLFSFVFIPFGNMMSFKCKENEYVAEGAFFCCTLCVGQLLKPIFLGYQNMTFSEFAITRADQSQPGMPQSEHSELAIHDG